MNKFLLTGLAMAIFSYTQTRADLLAPNFHHIRRNLKIENIDSFPDIAIIGYIGRGWSNKGPFPIYQDSLLPLATAKDKYVLFWAWQSWVESIGLYKSHKDPSNWEKPVDSSSMPPLHKIVGWFETPCFFECPNQCQLQAVNLFYKLYRSKDGISIVQTRRERIYSDTTITEEFSPDKPAMKGQKPCE